MEDIASYLLSKGCVVKAAGHSEVHLACVFHEEEVEKSGRLYIHVGEDDAYGAYICFVCGARGGLNDIRKFFGDAPVANANPAAAEDALPDDMFMGIQKEAANFYHENLSTNPEVYNYLREGRGLEDETIEHFNLGWADGGLITHLISKGFDVDDVKRTGLVTQYGHDFLGQRITIPYVVMGATVQIRGRAFGDMNRAKYLGPNKPIHHMLNRDITLTADRVVVTEGEMNCMSLHQLGYAAVGVPGAQQWKPEWTGLFENVKRVFLMYDMYDTNDAGKNGAENVAAKLGSKAKVTTLPRALPGQSKIDANEWMAKCGKSKEDFDYLFKKSAGGSLITVEQSYEQWTEVEGNPDIPQLRFNIPALDNAMEFGLMPGQVLVWGSKTGGGKTIGTLNLLQRMSMVKPDLHILNISLEQTRNEWFETTNRIFQFYNPGAEASDTIAYWSDKINLVDKNRVTINELEDAIVQYIEEHGYLDFLCLDYLGYFARAYPGEEYARVSAAMMDVKRLCKDYHIVIQVLSQAGRAAAYGEEMEGSALRGSGVIEETADIQLGFWHEDQKSKVSLSDHTGIANMKVKKSRNGGLNAVAQFLYAPLSRVLVPFDDPLMERAERERVWARAGMTWSEARIRHQHPESWDDPFHVF